VLLLLLPLPTTYQERPFEEMAATMWMLASLLESVCTLWVPQRLQLFLEKQLLLIPHSSMLMISRSCACIRILAQAAYLRFSFDSEVLA
jgi:hypothetical protein